VANILRPILIEFSEKLASVLKPHGWLILSGLIEKDVDPILKKYETLGVNALEVKNEGKWFCIYLTKDAVSKE